MREIGLKGRKGILSASERECVCVCFTGYSVCSSALSAQFLSAGSESPPWTDPLVSCRQTQHRTVKIHTHTHGHTHNEKPI